jgi:hypothetical protein
MLKVFRNGRYSTVIAISALILALTSVAFGISDAYASRTTTLAKALQSVGLCPVPGPESAGGEQNTALTTEIVPGADGAEGEAGVDGSAGADGTSGTDGKDGSAGADGNDGVDGAAGAAGANGTDGSSGSTGAQGATGPAGICDLSNILEVNGNLIPAIDNVYSLGTSTKRWKDLHVGPGTIYIQETSDPANQIAISVQAGALKFEGAQALKVGNIRLSATGITSETPDAPITLGDNLFNSFIQLQSAGLKFKDGSVQSTAAIDGATGPAGPAGPTGPRGLQGPQGETGRDGSIEGFIEVPVCVITSGRGHHINEMVFSKCGEIVTTGDVKGKDIIMLQKKE